MKRLPRFAIGDGAAAAEIHGTVRVTGSELHHMRDVLRLDAGAEVLVYGPNGVKYTGRIAAFEPNAATIAVGEADHQQQESHCLILAVGMIKAVRMDLLIEKAAELNAAEFWPLKCTRSVVREPSLDRQERWRRISLAATKQSLRGRTMEIHEPIDVAAMIRGVPQTALAVTCIAGAEPLSSVIRRSADGLRVSPKAVVLAIGPEGDFTGEEVDLMCEAGFVMAGLGNSRLRSETAAIAALSIAEGIFTELENSKPGA